MQQYQRINNILGWIVFAIASFVYLSTIEPTGSFWDCGEFIATANKLQVGHPPGAPLFLMLARVCILFAGDNVKLIPIMVNSLSAIMSALCILFLFWTITAFAKKAIIKDVTNITMDQIITVMGSGFIGAVAYTFTDSFWFSAVEGEVYASSAAFTACVFWAIMKWDAVADEKHSTRWIILIAFLMGLSIGVHLLNLLTIPALALVYYFRRYNFSWFGVIKTLVVGVIILAIVQFGVIQDYLKIGSYFDLFFVNTLHLPFWSGIIFFNLAVIVALAYGIYRTQKSKNPLWNTVLLCFAFILLGYYSYAQVVVRSGANPPLDENDPENVFGLLSYLNREQYGDFPLLYGQYFNAQLIRQDQGSTIYAQTKDKYIPVGNKPVAVYEPENCGFFPRMWSGQENHISAYKSWSGTPGDRKPTAGENLLFFFKYQVNHMFIRYFMWNFVGRQNDMQGHGDILKGNWICGINAIDAIRLGPQDHLPKSMTDNKARNCFYFLPLILGLLGMVYHFMSDRKDFMIVGLLFLMTGMAILLYLNQTPYQPRERDYAYAGAFYAFAIWIGLGVAAIADMLRNKINPSTAAITATLVTLVVPYVLAKDGWDDHNRSHRYTSRDFAVDYLNSCAPNGIIFTNGDNDTFPLWYAQEVENVRTDIRVVNLSLLNTDWYVNQMRRKAYQSEPVPFTLPESKYAQGTRDYIPYYDKKIPDYTDIQEVFNFITSDDEQLKLQTRGGNDINYLPTKKLRLKVDKEAAIKSGTVALKDTAKIVDYIQWDYNKEYVSKADLMMLDLIAHNNWKRPIYYAVTIGSDGYIGLENYFQAEGLAYRLVPIKAVKNDGQPGRVGADQMYDNIMNKFVWGNMNDSRVYLDQNNLNMTMNFRFNFARLADALIDEGKRDSSVKVLDKCMEVMPDKTVPFNLSSLRIIEMYYRNGLLAQQMDSSGSMNNDVEKMRMSAKANFDKGNAIVKRLADITADDLNYYFSLAGTSYYNNVERETNQSMAVFMEMQRLTKMAGQKDVAGEIEARFKKLESRYMQNGGGAPQ
ncbi:MAG: DUF2723 domain-containing protein [Bacteroidia bacterium]